MRMRIGDVLDLNEAQLEQLLNGIENPLRRVGIVFQLKVVGQQLRAIYAQGLGTIDENSAINAVLTQEIDLRNDDAFFDEMFADVA